MKTTNPGIKEKSFQFAIRIVNLYKVLKENRMEFVLSKQLLRSGTAIDAMVCEADHAESKADFRHKMSVAQKELNETIYWIDLLAKTDFVKSNEHLSLRNDALELMRIIIAIIKTSKARSKQIEEST